MKRYLRQYCNNDEIVTAAAKSLRAAAAIFIQTQPSLTDSLAQSFAQKKNAKTISHNKQRNIYIQDKCYVSNVFPVFFTIFDREGG